MDQTRSLGFPRYRTFPTTARFRRSDWRPGRLEGFERSKLPYPSEEEIGSLVGSKVSSFPDSRTLPKKRLATGSTRMARTFRTSAPFRRGEWWSDRLGAWIVPCAVPDAFRRKLLSRHERSTRMRSAQSAIPAELHAHLDSVLLPTPKGKQRNLAEVAESSRLIVTTFPFQRIVQ